MEIVSAGWNAHADDGATGRGVRSRCGAAVGRGEGSDDRQSKAASADRRGPGAALVRSSKSVEGVWQELIWEARTGVSNDQAEIRDKLAIRIVGIGSRGDDRGHGDLPSGRRIPECVLQEIVEDPPDRGWVHIHEVRAGSGPVEADLLLRHAPIEGLINLVEQAGYGGRLAAHHRMSTIRLGKE